MTSITTVLDPLKQKLEQSVAREFLSATKMPYRVLRAGVTPEPDIICEHTKTHDQVGIEIVTAYYDNQHAKSLWKPARGGKSQPYSLSRKDAAENIRVLAECARLIKSKSKKKYTTQGELALVVFTFPQRLYLCSVEDRLRSFRIPLHHPFDQIYVMSQHGEVFCLFPDIQWILR